MTEGKQNDFEGELRLKLAGARRVAVVGVGDPLLPTDRLGILAAEAIADLHLPNVRVFSAETVPESMTGPVRRYGPEHVLFFDAAEMGAPPGTVAIVEPEGIHATLFSTHALPLSLVMEFLAEDAHTRVTLIGIEPDTQPHGTEPTPAEKKGLKRLLEAVKRILGGN